MIVRIAGKRMYLWRAVDHEGEVLDMLVQRRRNCRAALRRNRSVRTPLGRRLRCVVGVCGSVGVAHVEDAAGRLFKHSGDRIR